VLSDTERGDQDRPPPSHACQDADKPTRLAFLTEDLMSTAKPADIAVVGLAVMGENLILNMASRGFTVVAYNRTVDKVHAFCNGRAKGTSIIGAESVADMLGKLARPRRVMLMVKAGAPVDDMIDQLIGGLEPGDIVIDGGNSHFDDTTRRVERLSAAGMHFVGTGVSGGEEGALLGPSIMPGGDPAAWPHIKPIFQAIAAKVPDGSPCCEWVGDGGAGHFVKMVHNGIEYGDMQMIAEAYGLLRGVARLSNPQIADVFAEWNAGDLDSYLISITEEILRKEDELGDGFLVDRILDVAGQKGTGKWTSVAALDVGAPAATIAEAVFARCLSARKHERVLASEVFDAPDIEYTGDVTAFVEQVRQALFASKICSYAQGFQLMRLAAEEHKWNLDYGAIALLWREGCIIRARFLETIKQAFAAQPDLSNLILDTAFASWMRACTPGWRETVATAARHGAWVPAFASALSWFDGSRSAVLPINLVQAQRDYFGAHTYERTDKPRGETFHTNWTGRGGTTASSTYQV
jgi:6-phosphogluconate dehydrogenase